MVDLAIFDAGTLFLEDILEKIMTILLGEKVGRLCSGFIISSVSFHFIVSGVCALDQKKNRETDGDLGNLRFPAHPGHCNRAIGGSEERPFDDQNRKDLY